MLKVEGLEISSNTARDLGAVIGEAASQTVFELLAILWALQRWRRFFRGRERVPRLRADSAGALGAVAHLASRVPAMNFLAAEISLFLETHDLLDPVGSHVPGALNKVADYASRLAAPLCNQVEVPSALRGVRVPLKRDDVSFWLPGPGRRPDLWGRSHDLSGSGVPHEEAASSSGFQ